MKAGEFIYWLTRSDRRSACDPSSPPSTMVVVAHPDDEVVGAGAHLPRLRHAVFVHLTDGAPCDGHDAAANGFATRWEYALARRRELAAALALAGIGPGQTRQLGYADQEAALNLVDLSRDLAGLLYDLRPGAVLTLPYEGGHPDHDATAFAVHAACRLLAGEGAAPPAIVEMTSYHMGPGGITPFEFLPCRGCEPATAFTVVLSDEQRELKCRLLDCFPTQRETLRYFPVAIERFRPAPRYDFTQPPHAGQLFYDCFAWGMTGERFRRLAQEALDALRLASSPAPEPLAGAGV